VKTFTDEIPRIPRRAFQDLDVDMSDYDIGSPRGSTPVFNKFFMPQQQQQHKIQVGSITGPIQAEVGQQTFFQSPQIHNFLLLSRKSADFVQNKILHNSVSKQS
jgi:hypothetical protein